MSSKVSIVNGRLVDPAAALDGHFDLHLADGRVAAVGAKPDGFAAERVIDATGLIVCPGFIDLCARLREPGQEHKATIASESAAALAAGVTTLCCPPDTDPVIDTPAVVNLIRERAEVVCGPRVLPIGALTRRLQGQDLSEMSALRDAGCLAVGNAHAPVANTLVLRRALEYAGSQGLLVVVRPEDPYLAEAGCVHEGPMGTRLGLPGIPEAAETVAVAKVLALVEHTGTRVHFAQLSTARAARTIAWARSRDLPVTADVSAHQLHLSEEHIAGFDALCHLRPPLRSREDRAGLREAVRDGAIAAICSDHQPHEPDAKLDAFPVTEPGLSGLETLLPLSLGLVEEGELTLSQAIAALSWGPAKVLGLALGSLHPGMAADVVVFDPDAIWTVGHESWLSRGRNTPYWGKPMRGRVVYSLVAGCGF